MNLGLVVTSNGRGALLDATLDAIWLHVRPLPELTLICDDSGDDAHADWMRERWPAARTDAHRHLGHGPAVARAWKMASQLPVEWLLWMEEDMVLQRPLDLRQLVAVMDAEPNVAQMALRRNAHFPAEVAAGPTQIERFSPEAFTERGTNGQAWLQHREFYSLNPHLVRRDFLARHSWPPVPNSEHRFGLRLFRDGAVTCGLWGPRDAEPQVLHIGTERTGTGY